MNADILVTIARSLKEIMEKVCEFDYEEDLNGGNMVCNVCGTTLKYSNMLKKDFTDKTKMLREFLNLKTTLKEHLKSKKHLKKTEENEQMEKVKKQEDLRNTAVGLIIR